MAKSEQGGYPVGNPERVEKGHPNGWAPKREAEKFVDPKEMPKRGTGPGYSEK